MNERIAIVNFMPWHFTHMRLRREDAADLAGLDAEDLARGWAEGRTLFKEREPVFIYGFTVNSGTASLWAVTSPLLGAMPLLITRLAKSGIERLFKTGVHRIEVLCHAKNARSLAWLTRCLGFQVEGMLRRCGPNRQDRFLLALIKEDTQ